MNSYSLQDYLVARSKTGDRRAQNELYLLYAKAMYNVCRRLLGNDDDAKDALQEAFVEVFVKINSLRDDSLFSAWVKRIVINRCINLLRKKKLDLVDIDGYPDSDWGYDDDDDFVNEKAKSIIMALDKISEGCRTVMNLYLFEGYDHSEIAQILGISESTSKAQYSKAKQKIRLLLEYHKA